MHTQAGSCLQIWSGGPPLPQIETRSMPNWQRHVAARDKVLRSRYPRTFDVFGEGGPWSSNRWEHHSRGMSSADKYKLYIAGGEEWFAKDRRHLICINFNVRHVPPVCFKGSLVGSASSMVFFLPSHCGRWAGSCARWRWLSLFFLATVVDRVYSFCSCSKIIIPKQRSTLDRTSDSLKDQFKSL